VYPPAGTLRSADDPIVILPVDPDKTTCPDEGVNKSPLLTACPAGVVTVIRPDVALGGIFTERLEAEAELTDTSPMFTLTSFAAAGEAKLPPVMVTVPPGFAITGVKLLMKGEAELAPLTTN
jgi:hypothetical protein